MERRLREEQTANAQQLEILSQVQTQLNFMKTASGIYDHDQKDTSYHAASMITGIDEMFHVFGHLSSQG